MATEEYVISCFIPGSESTFLVDVEKTRDVNHLKHKMKKQKQTFAGIDADHLILYRATIKTPLVKKARIEELERVAQSSSELMELDDEERELSDIFGESPPGTRFYVIVRIPESEFIYCRGCPLTPSSTVRQCLTASAHPLMATGDVASRAADVSPPFANIYLNTLTRLPKDTKGCKNLLAADQSPWPVLT